jgi:hypothetical protein
VRLAGGLLAQRELIADEEFDEEWGRRSHAVFRVSRPDGSAARRVSGQRWGGSWDFDGRRLAWVTQPCYQTVIRVWDVTTGRPTAPRSGAASRGSAAAPCGSTTPATSSCSRRRTRVAPHAAATATCAPSSASAAAAVASPRRTSSRAIHLAAGTTDGRWLNIGDPRKLRSVRGALRARFIFKSHGHRKVITRDIRR